MKKYRVLAVAIAAAAMLAGCGGSDPGNQNPRVAFTRMVNFGDSLSDVGTYKTQLVGANGEGLYSINGDFSKEGLPYTNWTQYLAASAHVTQPCAAEVGLDSPATGALAFMAQAPAFFDDATHQCSNYAQGGAMVTNPYGPGNAFYWTTFQAASGQLGQLTVPVVQQIANYLKANNNTFSDTDLVTVLAGGNDVFINRGVNVDGTVQQVVALEQAGQLPVDQGNAMIAKAAADAVSAMTQAGTDLAGYINSQILANGAKHVVVVNLPDVSVTPDNAIWTTTGAGVVVEPLHPHLTLDMVNAFNTALATGLGVSNGKAGNDAVLWVDAFTASDDQVADPAQFGLSNVKAPACQLDTTAANSTGLILPTTPPTPVPIASSLFCTQNSLTTDLSTALTYEFADTVHPTPFGYRLLAQLVAAGMAGKGWL